MISNRLIDLKLDIWGVALLLPLIALPLITASPFLNSLTYQCAIGISAALAVYITLRLGLLSFSVPSFMAVGGYASAMLAKGGVTDLILLMAFSFIVPAVLSLPLGLLVLRLKGVYFIIITFLFNEILQLVIFETPALTGGPNGIADIPPATLFGTHLASSKLLIVVTVAVCIVAALITLAVTQRFRAEFTSIEENETLSESLGVAVWKYRTIGFIASAGVSGLAGFALVNMLSTAYPTSFSSWTINNYIAYAFVGGRGSILGIVVGSLLLIVATNLFSGYANLSAGMFGVLLVVVMMLAPGGIVGTCVRFFSMRKRSVKTKAKPADWRQV